MLLPIFLLMFSVVIFLSYRMLSRKGASSPKFLTAALVGAVLFFCFFDRLAGSALGRVWVSGTTAGASNTPIKVSMPFWSFFDINVVTREASYRQPISLDPLYGIDSYFEEMIARGYSQIGVIHPYESGNKYLLTVTASPGAPTCSYFEKLPKTQVDTTSKIPWLLGRYTKDELKKANGTLVDGITAACISVASASQSPVTFLEKYEVREFGIFGIPLQYRATRKLINMDSNQTLSESREVWSDGGWFAKYVLANPETGTSGRGYRYGSAVTPFTIPSSPQAVNKS